MDENFIHKFPFGPIMIVDIVSNSGDNCGGTPSLMKIIKDTFVHTNEVIMRKVILLGDTIMLCMCCMVMGAFSDTSFGPDMT